MFRTARANLAHIVDPATTPEELDGLAEDAIYHAGRTYFDMFHASVEDYERGRAHIRIDMEQWQRLRRLMEDGRGTVLVGPHTSNFDMAAQWIAAQGFEMHALSLADPNAGTRVVNAVRERRGVTMAPINMGSLRDALRRLKRGGAIVTGVDRPASQSDDLLPFFGEPAPMPVGHIRMALQTGARILVAWCRHDPDGHYSIHFSGPIEMEKTGVRAEDIRHNALRVLTVIEDVIREEPGQWLMFVPVWPSDLEALAAGD
jgi:KDO2-lipid IV(A) lauroyltransferase